MSKRTLRRTLALAAVAALCAFVVPALAATPVPSKATIKTKGKIKFHANGPITDTSRFAPGKIVIKSGGTVTLKEKSGQDHTLSIVKKKDLITKASQLENCFEQGICGTLAQEHGFSDDNSPPAHPLVDGGDGFNKPYDSVVLFANKKVSFKVTAPKGTTLRFMCAIHPQMQGRIKVR